MMEISYERFLVCLSEYIWKYHECKERNFHTFFNVDVLDRQPSYGPRVLRGCFGRGLPVDIDPKHHLAAASEAASLSAFHAGEGFVLNTFAFNGRSNKPGAKIGLVFPCLILLRDQSFLGLALLKGLSCLPLEKMFLLHARMKCHGLCLTSGLILTFLGF